jgi:hypothetical protein
MTGEKIDRKRMKIVNGSKIWITGFIQFQYGNSGPLNEKVSAIRGALNKLRALGLFEEAIREGLVTLLDAPEGFETLREGSDGSETHKDKNKDKDMDKDKDIIKYNTSPNGFSDFDFEIADKFILRAQSHFKTVKADREKFTQSIHQLRTLDGLPEDKIRKILDHLQCRPAVGKKFCWFDQIGTPEKLRLKTKDGQFRIWEKVLQEISERPRTEKEIIAGGLS